MVWPASLEQKKYISSIYKIVICKRNSLNLLNERDDDDERGRDKRPDPADDRPRVESGKVEHVDAEHGAGPDADEKRGEKDAGDVSGDLGRSELSDDDV